MTEKVRMTKIPSIVLCVILQTVNAAEARVRVLTSLQEDLAYTHMKNAAMDRGLQSAIEKMRMKIDEARMMANYINVGLNIKKIYESTLLML